MHFYHLALDLEIVLVREITITSIKSDEIPIEDLGF